LPALESFPGRTLTLSRLSAPFVWQILLEPPEPPAPCWRTVATFYPLGNCDSLKPETLLSYLTRLGTVSHRSSPLSPFFAFTDGARTPPEELVNSASANMPTLRRVPCGCPVDAPRRSGPERPTHRFWSLMSPFPRRSAATRPSGLPCGRPSVQIRFLRSCLPCGWPSPRYPVPSGLLPLREFALPARWPSVRASLAGDPHFGASSGLPASLAGDLPSGASASQLCHPFRLRNCEQSPHRHPPSGLSMSC